MKYIITDKNEVRIGGSYHYDMLDGCVGEVVAAGHCEKLDDGTYRVWGESMWFGIKAKKEDAELIREFADIKLI